MNSATMTSDGILSLLFSVADNDSYILSDIVLEISPNSLSLFLYCRIKLSTVLLDAKLPNFN